MNSGFKQFQEIVSRIVEARLSVSLDEIWELPTPYTNPSERTARLASNVKRGIRVAVDIIKNIYLDEMPNHTMASEEYALVIKAAVSDLDSHYQRIANKLSTTWTQDSPIGSQLKAEHGRQSELLKAALKSYIRIHQEPALHRPNAVKPYISKARIEELRNAKSEVYDLRRLIHLCLEINTCYREGAYMAVAILIRTMLNHVPPIFACGNFKLVANNYRGGKSFQEGMLALENSSRKIADGILHDSIQRRKGPPTEMQVSFAPQVDVLLDEIVSILNSDE